MTEKQIEFQKLKLKKLKIEEKIAHEYSKIAIAIGSIFAIGAALHFRF